MGSSRLIQVISCTIAIAGAASVGFGPAKAETIGFLSAVRVSAPGFRSVAPAPGFSIVTPSSPGFSAPQVIALPSPRAVAPPDPSRRENPLVSVLRDPTLRYGDVVAFPDGHRVFRGEPGGRHGLDDFVALRASRDVAPASRQALLAMPVGENDAWSSDMALRTGQLARSRFEVETTGSIIRPGKTVTVRTGRGDVRVIRVPD